MITKQLEKLKRMRDALRLAEQKVSFQLRKELAALPSAYGYENRKALYAAIIHAQGKHSKRTTPKEPKKRRRAKITPKIREKAAQLIKSGFTHRKIAEALRVSRPSVQKIAKDAGLSTPRKKAVTK